MRNLFVSSCDFGVIASTTRLVEVWRYVGVDDRVAMRACVCMKRARSQTWSCRCLHFPAKLETYSSERADWEEIDLHLLAQRFLLQTPSVSEVFSFRRFSCVSLEYFQQPGKRQGVFVFFKFLGIYGEVVWNLDDFEKGEAVNWGFYSSIGRYRRCCQ